MVIRKAMHFQNGALDLAHADNPRKAEQYSRAIHSHVCMQAEGNFSIDEDTEVGQRKPCVDAANCDIWKHYLMHKQNCSRERCSFPYHEESIEVVNHVEFCFKPECEICGPLSEIKKLISPAFDEAQLNLLLHADNCIKLSEDVQRECRQEHCAQYKEWRNHVNSCTEHKTCGQEKCLYMSLFLNHWYACSEEDCTICSPFHESYLIHNTNGHATGYMFLSQIRELVRKEVERGNPHAAQWAAHYKVYEKGPI